MRRPSSIRHPRLEGEKKRVPSSSPQVDYPCSADMKYIFIEREPMDCCGKTFYQILGLESVERAQSAGGFIVKLDENILKVLHENYLEYDCFVAATAAFGMRIGHGIGFRRGMIFDG
eukprot:GHVU01228778.1.p2 GENE.GHVU01228778.1~~GHVU01228778.1.p2  ORF type:complete len:117 (+),score=9.14 GHVU01228778.1:245-595(+)